VVTLTHDGFGYWQGVTATILFVQDQPGNQLPDLPYSWEFTTQPYRVHLPLLLRNG
jgi:hypothetical protein